MEIENVTDAPQEITVDGTDVTVEPGGVIDVPKEVAMGEPAQGEPDDPNYWPGTTGLVGTGKFAKAKRSKANDNPPAGEEE